MTDSKLYHVALSREQIEIIIDELEVSHVQVKSWVDKWNHDIRGNINLLSYAETLGGIISELQSTIGA